MFELAEQMNALAAGHLYGPAKTQASCTIVPSGDLANQKLMHKPPNRPFLASLALLFSLTFILLTSGCSTMYREMARDTFHPKTVTDWCFEPVMIPTLAIMLPLEPLSWLIEDNQKDAELEERIEERRREKYVPSDAEMNAAHEDHERMRAEERARDIANGYPVSPEGSQTSSSSNTRTTPSQQSRSQPTAPALPRYSNEAAYGPEEQLAMSRILRVVEDDALHRTYFSGFVHGINFWTRHFSLEDGLASVTMGINLPSSQGVVLYLASNLSFNPQEDGSGNVSDSCLINSFSAMQNNIWLTGSSAGCCAASGWVIQRATSTLITVNCTLSGLEKFQHLNPRAGIVAVFALEIPE